MPWPCVPQLDEINQLFLPHMRNKLLWFYQEVEDAEGGPPADAVGPGPLAPSGP